MMNNLTIILKVEERLNKLSSNDYDNIEKWKIVEAFNKAMPDWCRRQLHGTNSHQTGDEQSKRRIDDLQVLLRNHPLEMKEEDCYYGSENWPDYFEYKRVSLTGATECCKRPKFVTYLVEEANIDMLLRDELKKPNFPWGETLVTLMDNTIKVWTNNEFEIEDAFLTYYKQPTRIQIQGVTNPYDEDGAISTADVICEFKDDIVEVLIDETVKIISGDIEYMTSMQVADKSVESNN
jgi:hypothetical protein